MIVVAIASIPNGSDSIITEIVQEVFLPWPATQHMHTMYTIEGSGVIYQYVITNKTPFRLIRCRYHTNGVIWLFYSSWDSEVNIANKLCQEVHYNNIGIIMYE